MSERMSMETPHSKRNSVKAYASRVFQESTVGTVSVVASTPSIKRKVFKILAFILFLIGFLYQSGTFLDVVLQYPTSVDIEVKRPQIFEKPAYTFCDYNGINRKIFCNKHPNWCEEPSEAICKKYGSYCGENKTVMPKTLFYNFHTALPRKEVTEYNDEMDNFVLVNPTDKSELGSEENLSGPYFRIREEEFFSNFICYSWNERVDNKLVPATFTEEKGPKLRTAMDNFKFTVRAEEMFLPGGRPGILFAMHSPFEAVNPFQDGIFMKAGRNYIVYISIEEEILQTVPYDTDCMNYTEMWEKNNYSGPRIREMCSDICTTDVSLQFFKCVMPFSLFPTQEEYCTPSNMDLNYFANVDAYIDDAIEMFEQCNLKCKDDCKRTKYRYNVQERFKKLFDEDGNIRDDIDDTIEVEIYIESNEVITYTHSPKYMTVEVFSAIGGFMGCWLGISLLDFTDVFEGFFRIIRYSFKRR